MKLVLIAYNEAIDEEVMGILNANGIQGYTKWTKVLGRGRTSGPHLSTHVWPKANNVLAVCVEEELVGKVVEGVRALRKTVGREGIKAFVVPIEDAT